MARRTLVIMTDDLDGADAEETVQFSLDGVTYEIDLSGENAAMMRTAFGPFVAAGRKIGKMVGTKGQKAPSSRYTSAPRDAWLDQAAAMPRPVREFETTREERDKIREWANGYGLNVRERGRIKEDIIKAWRAQDPTLMGVEPAPEPEPEPEPKAAPAPVNGRANGQGRTAKAAGRRAAPVAFMAGKG